MLSDPLTKELFPTAYPFYLEDQAIKKQFEEKFIAHYYYREIGFETPFIFIHKVEERLRLRAPYWQQLYETDLEAKKINFLLNKDLKETFIREITGNGESSSTGTSTGETNGTSTGKTNGTMTDTTESTGTGSNTSNDKQSMLADGVSSVSLTDGYLTGVANNESSSTATQESSSTATQESSNQSSSNTTATSQQTNHQTENNNSTETTELISQGNIGITSSAQLLKEWRQVLINMDEMIINEFEDLFLKIY